MADQGGDVDSGGYVRFKAIQPVNWVGKIAQVWWGPTDIGVAYVLSSLIVSKGAILKLRGRASESAERSVWMRTKVGSCSKAALRTSSMYWATHVGFIGSKTGTSKTAQ